MSVWQLHCQSVYDELAAQKQDIETKLSAASKQTDQLHTQKQVLKGQLMVLKQVV